MTNKPFVIGSIAAATLAIAMGLGRPTRTTDRPLAETSIEKVVKTSQGLHGYLGCQLPSVPSEYSAGMGFYATIWRLTPKPIRGFQVGLPSTWISPDNSDNKTIPLCPEGTPARGFADRGPTYNTVFQTVEGGIGYWSRSHFLYGPPKFSINGVPSCYALEVNSPGWSFFYRDQALNDDELAIAQLSNHIIVPPDGLPFAGEPNGEVLGYTYMALPFTDPHIDGDTPTGDQSWTLFLNAENFRGPSHFLFRRHGVRSPKIIHSTTAGGWIAGGASQGASP